MKTKLYHITLLILSLFLSYPLIAGDDNKTTGNDNEDSQAEKLSLSTTYIGDAVYNFYGGINQGAAYLGMIDISATLPSNALGWNGGEFFANMQNTHMSTPTANLVGDLQVFSNIENGDHTYIYQFWYKQTLGKFTLLGGLHDLNAEFFASDLSGEYINSSFGIMPAVSMNAPVAIFPKTALALLAKYQITNNLSIQAASYDGDPLDLDTDPYNTNLSLGKEQGFFNVSELHYITEKSSIKLGGYYHSGKFNDLCDSITCYKGNYGVYSMVDQVIWQKENTKQTLSAMFQIGVSPSSRSINDLFIAMGINYYAPFGRERDVAGIAIAHASISNQLVDNNLGLIDKGETVIETMYKIQLSDNIIIQPNIQYIINPGVNPQLNNALVGILRTYIEF